MLQEKAILVDLTISAWTGRKYDRKASQKVADLYRADARLGRYNKVLVDPEEMKKIQAVANKARKFHYENTLPWNDYGTRLLPTKNHFQYTEALQGFKDEFFKITGDFLRKYPDLVEQARLRLNGLFRAQDYPDQRKMASKFRFEVKFNPVPHQGDFRVHLNRDEILKMQKKLEESLKKAEEKAVQDMWQRLYDTVSRLLERLDNPNSVIRDSLITGLTGLVELLPRLNFTEDPNLERMYREVEQRLCRYSAGELRADTRARQRTALAASQILDAMSGYIGQ